MTTKNSILLIIKQFNGISYRDLLNKVRKSYSTLNSARAALGRALKDLLAYGFIYKQEENYFITNKGSNQINSEMKSKLILKLNQTIKQKNNYYEIDSIVKNLHSLIERSKSDNALLKAAKGSITFYLKDLNEIHKNINNQAEHLKYIEKIFQKQIDSLREIGFDDYLTIDNNKENIKKISKLLKKLECNQINLETNSTDLILAIENNFKVKKEKTIISLSSSELEKLLEFYNKQNLTETMDNTLTIYFSFLKIKFSSTQIFIIGPANKIDKI